ncbi:MAG: type II secretion system F family protein [Candidatus Marinimicrobia bacterium]|nr:type II secretion system F family protein [Candidatus Neomarinimicrobiota bacterium]
MPSFKFTAKKLDGEEINETREVEDAFALSRDLKKEGYILIDFEEEGKKKKFSMPTFSFENVSLEERMIFTRNLAVMTGAGLSLSRALAVLSKQVKDVRFKKTLPAIIESLAQGKSLSDSMAEHKKIFSNLYVAMIKAGEKSGKLHESLSLLAFQMETDAVLRKKVKGAMIYPSIIFTAMIGIGILMLIYVVPTLTSTFEELGVELPASTQFIVWLSNSLITNSLLILLVGLSFVVIFYFLFKNKKFKDIFNKILLKTPVLSALIQKINSARTARTLSSLLGSGVDIVDALDTTTDVLQNPSYKKVLQDAKKEIQGGENISAAFQKAEGVFPILVGEMIAVGEETGKISEMLLKLAIFYEGEVSEATKNMATIIEPVLMLVIGGAVGFFAVSMIKPMYSMMGGL